MSSVQRYINIGIVGLVGLIGVLTLLNVGFRDPNPIEIEPRVQLPNTHSELVIQLKQTHSFLAEYDRRLILRTPNQPEQSTKLLPDSGGYARAQLYQLDDGRFLIRGFFNETILVDPQQHRFQSAKDLQAQGQYLGAFDRGLDRQWQFLPAPQSPEQSLQAKGG